MIVDWSIDFVLKTNKISGAKFCFWCSSNKYLALLILSLSGEILKCKFINHCRLISNKLLFHRKRRMSRGQRRSSIHTSTLETATRFSRSYGGHRHHILWSGLWYERRPWRLYTGQSLCTLDDAQNNRHHTKGIGV